MNERNFNQLNIAAIKRYWYCYKFDIL